jgi:hypothetical protein
MQTNLLSPVRTFTETPRARSSLTAGPVKSSKRKDFMLWKGFEFDRIEVELKSSLRFYLLFSHFNKNNSNHNHTGSLPALSLGGSKNAMNPRKIKSFSSSRERDVAFWANFLKIDK